MKARIITGALAALMFGGMAILETRMVASRPDEPENQNSSAFIALAGEFRTVFANLLWIKADQYHHEFTETNPHWEKNFELIGMMDLITILDPRFTEAYSVDATIWSLGKKDNKTALKILEKGVKNNPTAWTLHRDIALMYMWNFKNPESAMPYAKLAIKYCDDDFYLPSLHRLVATAQREEREQSAK